MDGAFSDHARDELRGREARALGRFYSPWVHLLVPSAVGLAVAAWALATLDRVEGWEWAVPPITWVAANAAEWRIHRDLLHRRAPGFRWLYERHTLMHHRVFVEWDLELRSARELGLVMIPPFAQVLLVVLAGVPALAIALLGQPDAARLFLATEVAYVLSYEWLHLAYHLPAEGAIGRLRVTRWLRRHHQRHHAPQLMQRWNFNVTLPLWDHVRGTVWRTAGDASQQPVPRRA
jgi:hypothetical protein